MSGEEEVSQEVSPEEPLEKPETVKVKSEHLVCPPPPPHVKTYQDCCEAYKRGEMTDLDVLASVINDLRKFREIKE